MRSTITRIGGWKCDRCRERLEDAVSQEESRDRVVDKGDGSHAVPNGSSCQPFAEDTLGTNNPEETQGNRCFLLCNNTGVGNNACDCDVVENSIARNACIGNDFNETDEPNSWDRTPTASYKCEPDDVVADNRQISFVEHYDMNGPGGHFDSNLAKISDRSILEDEGFFDTKDLLESTKIIFVSDQEDERSSKPFETEDDSSYSEASPVGRSLDLQSDLEAKPSLTDVRTADHMTSETTVDNFGGFDPERRFPVCQHGSKNNILPLHSKYTEFNQSQLENKRYVSQEFESVDQVKSSDTFKGVGASHKKEKYTDPQLIITALDKDPQSLPCFHENKPDKSGITLKANPCKPEIKKWDNNDCLNELTDLTYIPPNTHSSSPKIVEVKRKLSPSRIDSTAPEPNIPIPEEEGNPYDSINRLSIFDFVLEPPRRVDPLNDIEAPNNSIQTCFYSTSAFTDNTETRSDNAGANVGAIAEGAKVNEENADVNVDVERANFNGESADVAVERAQVAAEFAFVNAEEADGRSQNHNSSDDKQVESTDIDSSSIDDKLAVTHACCEFQFEPIFAEIIDKHDNFSLPISAKNSENRCTSICHKISNQLTKYEVEVMVESQAEKDDSEIIESRNHDQPMRSSVRLELQDLDGKKENKSYYETSDNKDLVMEGPFDKVISNNDQTVSSSIIKDDRIITEPYSITKTQNQNLPFDAEAQRTAFSDRIYGGSISRGDVNELESSISSIKKSQNISEFVRSEEEGREKLSNQAETNEHPLIKNIEMLTYFGVPPREIDPNGLNFTQQDRKEEAGITALMASLLGSETPVDAEHRPDTPAYSESNRITDFEENLSSSEVTEEIRTSPPNSNRSYSPDFTSEFVSIGSDTESADGRDLADTEVLPTRTEQPSPKSPTSRTTPNAAGLNITDLVTQTKNGPIIRPPSPIAADVQNPVTEKSASYPPVTPKTPPRPPPRMRQPKRFEKKGRFSFLKRIFCKKVNPGKE